MEQPELGVRSERRSRYWLVMAVVGLLVVGLGVAGWQQAALAGISSNILHKTPAYQESADMQAVKADPQGTLKMIWEPTELEPSRALQQFVETEGFSRLHLVVDSTDPEVIFTVHIDDPQFFG